MNKEQHKLAKDNIKFPLKYDDYGQYIFDGDGNIFAQVRGWGNLQKLHNGKKVQNSIGEFIVDTLNAANR